MATPKGEWKYAGSGEDLYEVWVPYKEEEVAIPVSEVKKKEDVKNLTPYNTDPEYFNFSKKVKLPDGSEALAVYHSNGEFDFFVQDKNDVRTIYNFEGKPVDSSSLKGNFFKDIATELGPMAITALSMGGGGALLGSALAPTASTAVQTAIGNALIQGVGAEATGGDFFKGAATGAISSLAPAAISESVGGGMLGEALGKGLTSATTASILGGDATKAGIIGALTGVAGYTPPAEGLNSPLTMAQIESGLGTEGYGYGAQAASSGLFNPAVIGSGAYTQTSYPIDMAELAAADALQLMKQGIGIPAVEQNLVASGLDPLIAADLTQQISLNPNLTSTDLANRLISTYGSNIYDTTIDQINAAAPASTQPAPLPSYSAVPWDQFGKLLGGLFTMGAASQLPVQPAVQQTAMPAYKPADTMPVYSPEYFRQVQQYYNTYLPTLPRDVATPLQDWYSSGYTQPDSVTAKLFSGGV